MASFKNTFSWSASRDRLFRSCHRAYYYNYYGYWNGWDYKADPKTKLIYKLKKLQSTTLWAGSTVHDILQDILTMIKAIATGASEPERMEIYYQLKHLQTVHYSETSEYKDARKTEAIEENSAFTTAMESVKNGNIPEPTYPLLRGIARLKLRQGFKESLSQKKHPNNKKLHLYEHFYGETVDAEKAHRISEKIYSALKAFCESEQIKEMIKVPAGNWKSVDELNSYHLKKLFTKIDDHEKYFYNDIKIWCAIDFAYIDHNGELWIVDWKTGKENKEELQNQLASYAIFAQQEWGFPLEKIHLCGVYLNENGRVSHYPLTVEQVMNCKESIAQSCRNMLNLLANQAENSADESNFATSPDSFRCRYCNFKKVCPDALLNG